VIKIGLVSINSLIAADSGTMPWLGGMEVASITGHKTRQMLQRDRQFNNK